jgi:NADH dehydrogenase FAD-containing subunit
VFLEGFGSASIGGHNNLIVHLVPLALRGDNARTSQICEMVRNLRLALLEISIECGAMVVDVNKNGLTIEVDNHADYISAKTVIWAGGITASPLGQILARRTKAETDKGGRSAPEVTAETVAVPH